MVKFEELKASHTDPNSVQILTQKLNSIIEDSGKKDSEIVIVCIGTDRSTGDSLGPLVGTYLKKNKMNASVYGSLNEPVHAMNLENTRNTIQENHPNAFIIAIDACLGQVSSIGNISIRYGPLKPGAGVNKDLGAIGDISITAVVNVGGFMEYFVLQNTRLSLVMNMAEVIANSLIRSLMTKNKIVKLVNGEVAAAT